MASRSGDQVTPRLPTGGGGGAGSSSARVREITVESLVQASKLTVGKTEQLDQYLKRVTHLTLPGNDKKVIKKIQLLDRCPNLKVLYMYDNEIETIENLDKVPQLTHLHLQNNWIGTMENLENLPHLEKVYMEGNRIHRLEGLGNCLCLQELHLSNQNLSKTTIFTFEDASLRALWRSLRVLNLSNCRINSTQELQQLRGLQQLDLSKNEIVALDDVFGLLSNLSALVELDLRENPVTQMPKYREKAMTFSSARLQLLDKKDIDANQRRMMQTHMAHKIQKRQEAELSTTTNQAAASTSSPSTTTSSSAETIRKVKHGSSVHQLRTTSSSTMSKSACPQWEKGGGGFGVAGAACPSTTTALVRSSAPTNTTSNNNNNNSKHR